jgi:hypothetical protein
MSDTIRSFEVRCDDLRAVRLATEPSPVLGVGQMVLRIDRFGLTANNITYGVTGDMIGHWNFFPAGEGWGRIPAWGFAEVVAGGRDELPNGTRVFGFLPMSSHLLVEPMRVTPSAFTDGAAHRAALPPLYNQYRRVAADPTYDAATEDLQAIFYPLLVTSFVIDDYLADHDDFGAERVVLSSASSKTALGTAVQLSRRSGARPEVVGLTSPRNLEFVQSLGCYDEVVTYEDVGTLDLEPATAFVDLAGNGQVRRRVHEHLGGGLVLSSMVGVTHWDERAAPAGLPGPAPTVFFTPAQVDKRVREWGAAGYQERLGRAVSWLLDVVTNWIEVVEVAGLDDLEPVYLAMLDGTADPSRTFIVTLGDG